MPDAIPVERRRIALRDVALDVSIAGPDDGPLLVLLHGFPETSAAWAPEIARLAGEGWRVMAPDQRGYAGSDRPSAVSAYDLDLLARDVTDLVASVRRRRYRLVGHDWGGAVAWWVAERRPEGLDSACVIAAPHPAVWREAMDSDPLQRRLSRYVRFFGLPWLPEALIRLTAYRGLEAALVQAGHGAAEAAAIRAAWRSPGALTGMLNWYRAILRRPPARDAAGPVTVPVTLIAGEHDPFLAPHVAERCATLGPRVAVHVVPGAGHWPHRTHPGMAGPLIAASLRDG